MIHTDENTVALAEKFIDFGILKKKSFEDCQHIAAAIQEGSGYGVGEASEK